MPDPHSASAPPSPSPHNTSGCRCSCSRMACLPCRLDRGQHIATRRGDVHVSSQVIAPRRKLGREETALLADRCCAGFCIRTSASFSSTHWCEKSHGGSSFPLLRGGLARA